MPNWITQALATLRTPIVRFMRIPKNLRVRFVKLIRVRRAKNLTETERETCERYGEHVIGSMLAGGWNPPSTDLRALNWDDVTRGHARDWLTNTPLAPGLSWYLFYQRCPECHESIIYLRRNDLPLGANPNTQAGTQPIKEHFMAYPRSSARTIPVEVPSPYRDDFSEACRVLSDSPKASPALSRRCLQAILRDKAGTTKKDLADQIDEVIAAKSVPPHIQGELDAVRVIGNFAAHPIKSTATGEIIDVEPGEAEWNLDVVESLFQFFFVQPAITGQRKAALNAKLKAAGKPELQ